MRNKTSIPKWGHHLPNLLTMINAVMGILAIFLLVGGVAPVRTACALVFVGALADALDGKIARFWNVESALGKQLDSFADSITFGLVPAAILYAFPPLRQHQLLLPLLISYATAGFFRLARFNLGDFSDYFLGLPITAAGCIVSLYAIIIDAYAPIASSSHLLATTAILLAVLSGLMVSRIKIKRPQIVRQGLRPKTSGVRHP
ncbi:MAG: CDP-diacylglycerol--serine O-phosphatidyltransferase [Firmicutes bacterium]|nr:CDP-diacylglycerol--serine O-phosphatidyltransferase [Bacillota bacterium]